MPEDRIVGGEGDEHRRRSAGTLTGATGPQMIPMNAALASGSRNAVWSVRAAPGKNADLFIVRCNPAANINDVENVVVFKDGVGYNSAKLIRSVRGRFGEY
jgi:hypothetical protein